MPVTRSPCFFDVAAGARGDGALIVGDVINGFMIAITTWLHFRTLAAGADLSEDDIPAWSKSPASSWSRR